MAMRTMLHSEVSEHLLPWASLGGGRICVGTQPQTEDALMLPRQGVSHIATILNEAEEGNQFRDIAQQANLEWLWIAFARTLNSSENEMMHLQQYLVELQQSLNEGAGIYVHCDHSMERSLLLIFALCHYLGVPSANAYSLVHSFNPQKVNHLPRQALEWAASLGLSF